ncbi:MAG: AI-2E family transporter [Gemmatimonadales bacterium]
MSAVRATSGTEPSFPDFDSPPRVQAKLMPSLGILTALATVAALRSARDLVFPVILAILLSLLFSPLVRWLRSRRIPEALGAAIVVFGAAGLCGAGVVTLSGPVSEFIARAPASLSAAETKLRALVRPLQVIQTTAERVESVTTALSSAPPPRVELAAPGIVARWSGSTIAALVAVFSTVFLTYFLLASGPMLRKKVADVLPGRFEHARFTTLYDEIELVTSHYLLLTLTINGGVAVATATGLWLVGMPNAALWGLFAGALNFVPYLGALTTTALLALAVVTGPEPAGHQMLAPIVFLFIHLVESNLVTPTILGRKLPLSAIAIFAALIFWGWLWGILGVAVAVPLTVVLKVTCDHVPGLQRLGALLND